jgi:hypothetical protein
MIQLQKATFLYAGPFLTIYLGGRGQSPFSLKYKQNIGRKMEFRREV